jgi:hypothetical protein
LGCKVAAGDAIDIGPIDSHRQNRRPMCGNPDLLGSAP